MSVNVRIRTNSKELDFVQVLKQIADEGYNPTVKFIESNFCEFYQYSISTRPIDLSIEDNGYDVRITSLACSEDYELFAKTIHIVQELTKGNVFYEDDDEAPIKDIESYFGQEWIALQMKSDANIINTLVLGEHTNDPEPNKMHEVGLYGPISMFYIGENLLDRLGITIHTDWQSVSEKLIEKFRYSQYARPRDSRRTTTSMEIKRSADSTKNYKLTVYGQNDYDIISRTDYFALKNNEGEAIILEYEDFMKVAPEQWERFDNSQYYTTPLSDKQYKEFWDKANTYCLNQPAPKLDYDEDNAQEKGVRMTKALFFSDVDYIRERITVQDLPPCAKAKPSKYSAPPIFYAIAKCLEIIFGRDDYAPEYMPVVSEMRQRTNAMLDFWEREMGIPKWDTIPFNEFADMYAAVGEDETIADVMGYEPKDFREAGFNNPDLLLYMAAIRLDFNGVLNGLRAGCDPYLTLYPASNNDDEKCTVNDVHDEAVFEFKHLYALYRWYIDSGEMIMRKSDCGRIIRCAAHIQMYEFIKEHRNKYLKKH